MSAFLKMYLRRAAGKLTPALSEVVELARIQLVFESLLGVMAFL